MRLGPASPVVISDLLSYKFPSITYNPRRERVIPSRVRSSQQAGPRRTSQHGLQVAPSSLLPPKLRRFPGECLPHFPLTSAFRDPSILDRVIRAFKDGLIRTGLRFDKPLPLSALVCLRSFRPDRVPFKLNGDYDSLDHLMKLIKKAVGPTVSALAGADMVILTHDARECELLGQPGELQLGLKQIDGEEGLVNLIPVETNWEPIDIRILKPDGQLKERLEGDPYIILALQMLCRGTRFGLYCAPYFVLTELVVENGRTHMLISPAAFFGNFLAALVSLSMNFHPSYEIEGPSEDTLRSLRDAAEKLEQDEGTPLDPPSRPSKLDETALIPFVEDGKTVVSVQHHPDRKIVCGADTKPDSDMLAIGVDLHCNEFFPNTLRHQATSDSAAWVESTTNTCGLDHLDLVTKIGGGAHCRSLVCALETNRSREGPLVAKVVSARHAFSIAREYFVHTRIVPLLSPAARAFIPKFHGLYRSGSDGYAYVFVFEKAGAAITETEWDSDEELRSQAEAAFQLIADEGLVHCDERAPNVVRGADGQIFLVDWGEAYVEFSRLRRDF
ncbi:BQ2448_4249 [Microbotryum intermedium]|uniref:BQ2448_4249 protein n=1 Tax=Microbotryum intermedium TaxID=269621 RepID=A0A238FFX3_9BASI|nr:BQ2448_4249 [Microbotryum intermedium]